MCVRLALNSWSLCQRTRITADLKFCFHLEAKHWGDPWLRSSAPIVSCPFLCPYARKLPSGGGPGGQGESGVFPFSAQSLFSQTLSLDRLLCFSFQHFIRGPWSQVLKATGSSFCPCNSVVLSVRCVCLPCPLSYVLKRYLVISAGTSDC